MSNDLTVATSAMSLFGKVSKALEVVDIDLKAVIGAHKHFLERQQIDPEFRFPEYRAKVPSGGGKQFEIVTGNEDLDTFVAEFEGVIVNFRSCNALFSDEAANMPPVCASVDGIKGVNADGECFNCCECPNNQWGSADNNGRAKKCKNMRRLHILVKGSNVPIVLSLPPTSINNWEKYKSSVLGVQRLTPADVLTSFSLSCKENSNGQKYSVVNFKVLGVLGSEVGVAVKALSGNGAQYDDTVTAEDYTRSE